MAKTSFAIPAEPSVADELRALVALARIGDPSGLARIREILDSGPEIWQYADTLRAMVERVWKSVMGADDPATIEPLERMVTKMKAELGGDQPSRLEQMLVTQVVANWREINYLQRITSDADQTTFKEICLERLESSYKGHDAALKQLATVRRLIPRSPGPAVGIRLFEPEPRFEQVKSCLDEI